MLKRVRRRGGPHGSSCGVEEETDLLKTDGAIKYRGVLQRKNIYDAPKEKPTAQNENINIDTRNESIIIIKGLHDDTYQLTPYSVGEDDGSGAGAANNASNAQCFLVFLWAVIYPIETNLPHSHVIFSLFMRNISSFLDS